MSERVRFYILLILLVVSLVLVWFANDLAGNVVVH